MAKYTFSQGKVTAEAGVLLSQDRRSRRQARVRVLIVVPLQSLTEEQLESSLGKENTHDNQ